MKIAIMGAGMAGAYLYRLLRNKTSDIDVFDLAPRTRCGLTPCAWGTSKGFEELVAAAGLDPEGYVLSRFDVLMLDDVPLKGYYMTCNKQKLIHDLLEGSTVSHETADLAKYDRIIDATGPARAFLPPLPDDFVLTCIQHRIKSGRPLENRIRLGKIGYAWSFPLGSGEYHIGCGCLKADPRKVLHDLGWLNTGDGNSKMMCGCSGDIRLTAPLQSSPFVVTQGAQEIWGVGEAIGCVAPLAGDGIVPGMKTVEILLAHWDDPRGYEKAILKEFKWMESERRVLDKLVRDESLTPRDAWVLVKNSKRMNIRVGLKSAAWFLGRLR